MVPVEVIAVVFDAEAEAMGFGDVDGAIVSEANGSGRGDAGDLAVGRDLEGGAGDERGATFAGHTHEAGVGLGLRTTALDEVRLSLG